MVRLANRVSSVPILKMDKVIAEVRRWEASHPGQTVRQFTLGDTAFGPPQRLNTALRNTIGARPHKYGPVAAEAQTLQVLAQDFERMGITGQDPQTNLCVTNGTLEGFTLTAL
ncbi:MAG: hypothetical protein WCV91_05585, partial [Candidatus Margulisiibacteriota bacterium]